MKSFEQTKKGSSIVDRVAISEIPEDKGCILIGQDLKPKILNKREYECMQKIQSDPDNKNISAHYLDEYPKIMRLFDRYEKRNVSIGCDYKQKKMRDFGSISVNQLTFLPFSDDEFSEVTNEQIDLLMSRIISITSHDVTIRMHNDCHSKRISGILRKSIHRHHLRLNWKPDFIYEVRCEKCAIKNLESNKFRVAILYHLKLGDRMPKLQDYTWDKNRVIFLIEYEEGHLNEILNDISYLSDKFPHCPVKIKINIAKIDLCQIDSKLWDVIRKTPQLSFYNCDLQRVIGCMSGFKVFVPPCAIPGNMKLSVDMKGNVYPCSDYLSEHAKIGNILDDDSIENLLLDYYEQIYQKYIRCLDTCSMVRVCGGCLNMDCGFVNRILGQSLKSAKNYAKLHNC